MSECNKCIKTCCLPRDEKPELVVGKRCVVPPGIYENVTVEINERCEIVRMEDAERYSVSKCDRCR